MPWLPFILYKIAGMGNTWVYDHGSEHGPAFNDMIRRMRYDFELTKAELIKERFIDVFIDWCRENKVQSRMQAYGRGYFTLDGGFECDIPEGETWIRAGLGMEINETDYRIGRAYTMVNKYVSSAAHLKGKKLISCEELTNIHQVFNESLELMKVAGDQSIISGITHPVFHGFNYSPQDAAFPGWVIYGTFINERNPWWPYFRYFTEYKSRLSALLQQATMYADIAVLPATADLWSIYSAQNDPFPAVMHPDWETLVWEAIHQNGCGCDYISERVIRESTIQKGYLHYNKRKYHSIFLTQVDSMEPATAKKLFEFIESGGRIFFIETFPSKASGWSDHEQRDKEVQDWIKKMQNYPDRCIRIDKPSKDHTNWYASVRQKYNIQPYVQMDSPNKFISQVRYQAKDTEIIVIINSNMNGSFEVNLSPSAELTSGKQIWLWDPETGDRFKLSPKSGTITIDLAAADLKLLVFDKEKKGFPFQTVIKQPAAIPLMNSWSVTGQHVDGSVIRLELGQLQDLKDQPGWLSFSGSIVYKTNMVVDDKNKIAWIDLGKAYGVSELFVNGQNAGVKWYGKRLYHIGKFLRNGKNTIEIKLTTTLGNYLKSLKDNRVGQYWTNEGRTIQPVQSIGLSGPVTIY
jgi:hypothetical protein